MNYSELRRAITTDLASNDPLLLGQIDNFIVQAESLIWSAVRLPSFTAVQKFSMTAGDPTSLVPFDFLGADHVVIPGYKPMRMKSSSFIKEAFVGSPLSMPEYFAMEDNFTILWGPVPDDDYVVEIGYFCRPESIVTLPQTTQAGVSAPDPLNRETYTSINFPTLLLHGALAFGYGFQRDFEARNSSMDAFTKTLTLANGYVKGKFSVQDFEKASAAIVTE